MNSRWRQTDWSYWCGSPLDEVRYGSRPAPARRLVRGDGVLIVEHVAERLYVLQRRVDAPLQIRGKAWIASPTKKQRAAPTVAATVSTYWTGKRRRAPHWRRASHASSDTTASGNCGEFGAQELAHLGARRAAPDLVVAGRMMFAVRGSSGSRDGRRPNLGRRVFGLVEREGTVGVARPRREPRAVRFVRHVERRRHLEHLVRETGRRRCELARLEARRRQLFCQEVAHP